jgi:hypothetical protein
MAVRESILGVLAAVLARWTELSRTLMSLRGESLVNAVAMSMAACFVRLLELCGPASPEQSSRMTYHVRFCALKMDALPVNKSTI